MRAAPSLPLALVALLLTGACAYDGATGYAPAGYPADYDSGMGSGLVSQPGDQFGGQNVASVAVFEAPLAPYGEWINSRFGRAFRPDVDEQWRPYVNGRWGEDRLWVSDDPWGWATDHYGRWGFDERAGWVWVPGTEWAPSWVAFRDDPAQNVSGWAPIPPNVNYSVGVGFGTGFGYDNFSNWYAPSWVWVPRGYVHQPGFGGRVLPWRYGANYWGGSRWQLQPGWGGRSRFGGVPGFQQRGGNWQGRPLRGGEFQGRPPQDGQFRGRPPRTGQYEDRQLQDGQFRGRQGRPDGWAGERRDRVRDGRGDESFGNRPRQERQPGNGYRQSQAAPGDPPMAAMPRNRQAMAMPGGANAAPRSEPPPQATLQAPRPAPPPRFERPPPRPEPAPNGPSQEYDRPH